MLIEGRAEAARRQLPLNASGSTDPGDQLLINSRTERGLGALLSSLFATNILSGYNNNNYQSYNPYSYYGLGYRPFLGSLGNLGGSYIGFPGIGQQQGYQQTYQQGYQQGYQGYPNYLGL